MVKLEKIMSWCDNISGFSSLHLIKEIFSETESMSECSKMSILLS